MNFASFSRAAGLGLVLLALLVAVVLALTRHEPAARLLAQLTGAPGASRPVASPSRSSAPDAPGLRDAPSAPRFAAVSDRFELVGALDGRRLTLWLDRFADNAPVTGATLELEIGDLKLVARPVDDRYEAELPAASPPGMAPVTVTVTAGGVLDLLAAELIVPAAPERTR